MMFANTYSKAILEAIKKINDLATYTERIEEMIRLKEQVREEVNDELDEIFSLIQLKVEQTEKREKVSPGSILQGVLFMDETTEREEEHIRLLNLVHSSLDRMSNYDRELFLDYVEKGSSGKMIAAMKTLTGGYFIPKRSILDTVKKVKDRILADFKRAAA